MALFFKKTPKMPRKQMFASVPVRNPEASIEKTEDGMRVTLTRDQTRMPWYVKLMPSPPQTRTFELDSVGAFVWDMCNGTRTIAQIADALADEKKLEVKEAEVALINYLRMLNKRGVVGLRVDEGDEA
ncbi:PqqD family protein [Planctomycetota bacterium]